MTVPSDLPQSLTRRLARMSRAQLDAVLSDDARGATVWIASTAVEGLASAQVAYGRMLLEGTGVPRDRRAALGWFRRAAEQFDPDGLNMLGRCLENGWGCPINPSQAAVHFEAAAVRGHAWAQYNLGHLYLDGLGVARDRERAYRYYLAAANQQHARAMNLVGRCLEQGWGVAANAHAAALWYRKSAEGGYYRGQFNWASWLLGAAQIEQAAHWFKEAAKEGSASIRRAILQIIRTHPCQAFALLALQLDDDVQGAPRC